MFSRFFNVWGRFCFDFLGLRNFWLEVAVFIPMHLFLLEARIRHGSIQGYLEFKQQEEEKERLAKHRERFRNFNLSN